MAAKQAISERAARFRATFGATLFFGHGTEPPQARSSKYKTIDVGTGIAAELLERGVRGGWSGLEWLEELALPEPALAELLLHIISAKAASGDLSASRWLDELENRFTSAPETGAFWSRRRYCRPPNGSKSKSGST